MFLCNIANTRGQTIAQIDQADIIVEGSITQIVGPMMHDLGTEYFWVTLKIEDVLKQTFPIDTNHFTFTWIVSNLRCSKSPLSQCIKPYESDRWIFMLKQKHLFGGEELPDSQILKPTLLAKSKIRENRITNIRHVDHESKVTTCSPGCAFCKAVKQSDWSKVERHIKKSDGRPEDIVLRNHERVLFVLSDDAILLSLPAYMSQRVLFKTASENIEYAMTWQIGVAPSRFYPGRNTTDKVNLVTFKQDSKAISTFIDVRVDAINNTYYDSSFVAKYGEPCSVNKDLIKRWYIHEAQMPMFSSLMSRTISDDLIRQLEANQAVYSLAVLVSHSDIDIGLKALRGLARIDDPRCVTFLVEVANHEQRLMYDNPETSEARKEYRETLTATLDSLLRTEVNFPASPLVFPKPSYSISERIALWEKCFIVAEATY